MASQDFNPPDTRAYLDISNWSTVSHPTPSGRVGEWARSAGIGYTWETLLSFDVSSLEGDTVESVSLSIDCNTKYGLWNSLTLTLFEQDKTAPASWSSPPQFNDFAQTTWSNSLQTTTPTGTGTHTFSTSAAFVTYVQSWLDDSANNWGLVISASAFAVDWGLSVDDATLTINYTGVEPEVTPRRIFHIT